MIGAGRQAGLGREGAKQRCNFSHVLENCRAMPKLSLRLSHGCTTQDRSGCIPFLFT